MPSRIWRRTLSLRVRTVNCSLTSAEIMLCLVPPWIEPTVTTAGSVGSVSRLTSVCKSRTLRAARRQYERAREAGCRGDGARGWIGADANGGAVGGYRQAQDAVAPSLCGGFAAEPMQIPGRSGGGLLALEGKVGMGVQVQIACL